MMMTDESKKPIKTYAYDAFGRIRSETGEQVMNRWTYTGREALGDSAGLYYYRWRVMDPNTGRFTSEDPLGFVDGPNRYGYCANDPVNFMDPHGLQDYDPVREAQCRREKTQRDMAIVFTFSGDAFKNVGGGGLGGAIIGGGIGAGIGAIFGGVGALPGAKIGGEIGLGVGAIWGLNETRKAWDKMNKALEESQNAYYECLIDPCKKE